MGKNIIAYMERKASRRALIRNEPPTRFINKDIREYEMIRSHPRHYGLGYGCIVLGLLDTSDAIEEFLEKVADGKYLFQNLFV